MIRRLANRWAWAPVLLLLAMFGGQALMISKAVADPGFSLERDFYEKAVAWDATQAQNSENLRLGWQAQLAARSTPGNRTELTFELQDARSVPLSGASVAVECFPIARAGDRITASLPPDGAGRYRTTIAVSRSGLWEFRFAVVRDGQPFTSVLRRDLTRSAP